MRPRLQQPRVGARLGAERCARAAEPAGRAGRRKCRLLARAMVGAQLVEDDGVVADRFADGARMFRRDGPRAPEDAWRAARPVRMRSVRRAPQAAMRASVRRGSTAVASNRARGSRPTGIARSAGLDASDNGTKTGARRHGRMRTPSRCCKCGIHGTSIPARSRGRAPRAAGARLEDRNACHSFQRQAAGARIVRPDQLWRSARPDAPTLNARQRGGQNNEPPRSIRPAFAMLGLGIGVGRLQRAADRLGERRR